MRSSASRDVRETAMARRRNRIVWGAVACLAVTAGRLVVAPEPAWAQVTARDVKVEAHIETSLPSCVQSLFVYSTARFEPAATEDEVLINFSGVGAPLNVTDQFRHPGGGTTSE